MNNLEPKDSVYVADWQFLCDIFVYKDYFEIIVLWNTPFL